MISKNKINTTKKYILIITTSFLILAALLLIKVFYYHEFVPDWDEANHLLMSYYYYSAINSGSLKVVANLFKDSNTIYPPLYHILTSFSYRLIHSWPYAAILTNIPFILILMLSVYGIGERLGNKKAGLLAALLTPILPIFLTVQEKAAIDYPSVSVFIASFYLLFKTENFTNRKYSILFGLSIFAGLLIKWPFVIPAIPFVFYAIRSLYSSRHNRRPVATNISLALLVLLPAISWYLFNHNSLVTKLSFFWNPNGFAQILWSNPHGLNFQNLLLYSFKSPLEPAGVGIIVLVFFYVSLFKVHKKYNERLLLLSIAITYIVLTFLDDKSSLYMIYTYPLAMILILVTLYKIKGLRRDVLIVILSISILTNFTLTQLNYSKRTQVFLADLLKDSIYILPNYDTKYIYGVWQTQNIVNFAYERGGCSENMLVFPDRRFLNPSTVNFYIVSKGINSFAMPAYAYYNPASDGYFDTSRLSSYQCIISTTGDPGTFANKEVLDQVNNYLLSHREYKLKTYSEPDGETILLFIKI